MNECSECGDHPKVCAEKRTCVVYLYESMLWVEAEHYDERCIEGVVSRVGPFTEVRYDMTYAKGILGVTPDGTVEEIMFCHRGVWAGGILGNLTNGAEITKWRVVSERSETTRA